MAIFNKSWNRNLWEVVTLKMNRTVNDRVIFFCSPHLEYKSVTPREERRYLPYLGVIHSLCECHHCSNLIKTDEFIIVKSCGIWKMLRVNISNKQQFVHQILTTNSPQRNQTLLTNLICTGTDLLGRWCGF